MNPPHGWCPVAPSSCDLFLTEVMGVGVTLHVSSLVTNDPQTGSDPCPLRRGSSAGITVWRSCVTTSLGRFRSSPVPERSVSLVVAVSGAPTFPGPSRLNLTFPVPLPLARPGFPVRVSGQGSVGIRVEVLSERTVRGRPPFSLIHPGWVPRLIGGRKGGLCGVRPDTVGSDRTHG